MPQVLVKDKQRSSSCRHQRTSFSERSASRLVGEIVGPAAVGINRVEIA